MTAKPLPNVTRYYKRKCSIPGCSNNDRDTSLSFHCLPIEPVLREEWIRTFKANAVNFDLKKNARICSAHFSKECFERLPEVLDKLKASCSTAPEIRKYVLLKGSVPSIFTPQQLEMCLPRKTPPSEVILPNVNPHKKRGTIVMKMLI